MNNSLTKNKTTKTIFNIVFVVLFMFSSKFALAVSVPVDVPTNSNTSMPRSYSYPLIEFDFSVHNDSIVDVSEKEIFNFNGEYHLGWRSLSLHKIDRITDIEVIDGATNIPLKYVSSRLDKTNPNSWGSYTVFSENNSKNIEWYFNEKDSTHVWVLKYKLHGAIGFYKDHDELYYNLLTDFTAPVENLVANVTLPSSINENNTYSLYRTNQTSPMSVSQIDDDTFQFIFNSVTSGEDVTIAPGWQKGYVNQSSYWVDFRESYWGIIWAILAMAISGLFSLVYWYIREKRPIDDMTIITQFEPPENLPPAMAEIIMKENITKKAFPATIVDLACRGYLVIIEETPAGWARLADGKNPLKWFSMVPTVVLVFVGIVTFFLPIILMGVILGIFSFIAIFKITKKEYIIKRTEKTLDGLRNYEQEYFNLLFKSKASFSTLKEKSNTDVSYLKQRYESMKKIQKDLFTEMNIETKAFAIAPKWKRGVSVVGMIIAFVIFINDFGRKLAGENGQEFMFALGIILSLVIIFLTLKNPRLNKSGLELKSRWLGFKSYINTAERYRLQNLTPDLFEKYLPYAMIFGIEKKWARSFESMNIQQPSWYVGSVPGAFIVGSSAMSSGFSPSSFSSSFSSSFASSFGMATGGAGGASGGGGAGGGGGGGGGGAS